MYCTCVYVATMLYSAISLGMRIRRPEGNAGKTQTAGPSQVCILDS